MKLNYKILIKENHPCVVEVPEEIGFIGGKMFGKTHLFNKQKEAYQLAKDNAVRFDEQIPPGCFDINKILKEKKEGAIYDCPDDYKICTDFRMDNSKEGESEYAYLIPLDTK